MGEHRQDLNRQIASAILRRSDVSPVHAAAIREFLLGPLACLPQFLYAPPNRKLNQGIGLLASARLRDPPLEQRRTSGGGLSVISGSTVCQKLMFMAQQPCRKLKFLAYPTEPF